MAIRWATLFRQPQTYGLTAGILLGYGVLLGLAGPRPLAWLGGGGIAVAMAGAWVSGFRAQPVVANPDNLLGEGLELQLQTMAASLPRSGRDVWEPVQQQAREAQQFARRICDRDPLLRSDLLEALHTVVDLARQVAEALQVMDHIQTPAYRRMAQQRLRVSCDRMSQTHAQLQQLQDQVVLSSLDASASESPLPQRLQTLIAANRQILNTIDAQQDVQDPSE